MKWLLAAALVLALVGTACGAHSPVARPAQVPAHPSAGIVYVSADQALLVVDSATGRVARTLPAGTPAPDWSRLYRLVPGALDVLDPADGRVVASHPAPAWAEAVHTSADGRWLVLSQYGPDGRFEVQDAAWSAAPLDVALRGSFTFDGISGDGHRLYLLEQLGGGRYQVRMYDLRLGQLAPYVIADKSEIGKPMSGLALAGYTTADGAMQLTLYQRSAGGRAFVHELPIGQDVGFAFCADLPGRADGWVFVAAPDGRRFYAANPADASVVELTARPSFAPPAMRVGQLGARGDQPAAVVSPDGSTLYVDTGSQLEAIATGTLAVRNRGLDGQQVTALAMAPDGSVLYAVSGATKLLRLDPRTLAVAGEVTVGGPLGAILHTG